MESPQEMFLCIAVCSPARLAASVCLSERCHVTDYDKGTRTRYTALRIFSEVSCCVLWKATGMGKVMKDKLDVRFESVGRMGKPWCMHFEKLVSLLLLFYHALE